MHDLPSCLESGSRTRPDDIRVDYRSELPVVFPDGQRATYSVIVVPLLGNGAWRSLP